MTDDTRDPAAPDHPETGLSDVGPAGLDTGTLDTGGLDTSGLQPDRLPADRLPADGLDNRPVAADLDTPGREATPEQDAAVASLLGLLRGDDIAMPDDVVRRLDAVLAEERRRASARARTGLAAVASLGDDSDEVSARSSASEGSASSGLATVLPIGGAPSRRSRDLGWLTWLGGAAAAVVVVGGGVAVFGHGVPSSVTTASSGVSAEAATGRSAAATESTAIRATNTRYSATTLTTQVGALLSTVTEKDTAVAAAPADAPVAPPSAQSSRASAQSSAPAGTSASAFAPSSPTASTRSGFSSADVPQSLQADSVAACMTRLELPGVVPLVVDRGTFDGKPADVIVVATEGDPTKVDVYVLKPGCATSEPIVYEFATVPRA